MDAASVAEATVSQTQPLLRFPHGPENCEPLIGLVLTSKTGRSSQVTVSLTDGDHCFLTMKYMIIEIKYRQILVPEKLSHELEAFQ